MPAGIFGRHFYATATKSVAHGAPCVESGIAGIAIKKVTRPWSAGFSNQATIDVGEKFGIEYKGEWLVPAIGGAVDGSPVYIVPATNVLTLTATANTKFGMVVAVAGENGCPVGKNRVSLDLKNQF